MALLYTMTVGALVWWFGSGWVDTRFTMGKGGPWVYGFVFLVVAFLTAHVTRLRRAAAAADVAALPRRRRSFPLIAVTLLLAGLLSVIVAFAFEHIGVGDDGRSVFFGVLVLTVIATPVALVVAGIIARLPLRRTPTTPAFTATQAITALLPLLVPLLAMVLLDILEPDDWWTARVDGPARAGILYYTLLPLMLPTAAAVAWGLDRLDGSTGTSLSRGVLVLALAVLALAVLLLPGFLEWCSAGTTHRQGPPMGFTSGVRYWHPFDIWDPETRTTGMLPLAGFFRACAAMMLACAGATAFALRQLGRGLALLTPMRIVLMFALQVLLTSLLMPRFNLAGAPLAACATVLLSCLPIMLGPGMRTRPTGSPPPLTVQ